MGRDRAHVPQSVPTHEEMRTLHDDVGSVVDESLQERWASVRGLVEGHFDREEADPDSAPALAASEHPAIHAAARSFASAAEGGEGAGLVADWAEALERHADSEETP